MIIRKDTTKSIDNLLNNNTLEFSIEKNVYSLTNSKVAINKIYQLYDIQGEPNYVLAVFKEGGYAIASKDAIISECSLHTSNSHPYKNFTDSGLIYAGPGNYIVEKNNQ